MSRYRSRNPFDKDIFIAALIKSNGIVTTACMATNFNDDPHYKLLRTDPEYKAKVDSINESVLDMAEQRIHDHLVQNDDRKTSLRAAMFLLEKRGRARGYGDRSEITHRITQEEASDEEIKAAMERSGLMFRPGFLELGTVIDLPDGGDERAD